MIRPAALGALCVASILSAADFSSYRGLQFGMSLAEAAKEAGTRPGEVMVLHQRPALIQELDWHLKPAVPANPANADPVKGGSLSFLNGELFRIIVNYDRYRIEGMTAEDMVLGISATYGLASRPTAKVSYQSNYGVVAPVVARWEDSEYSYNLVHTGDGSSFAMVLYSKRLDAMAQAAIIESARLDALDAPRREMERQKLQAEQDRLILDKARSVNMPNFRP